MCGGWGLLCCFALLLFFVCLVYFHIFDGALRVVQVNMPVGFHQSIVLCRLVPSSCSAI